MIDPQALAAIGQAAFGGESPHPPGFGGVLVAELDGYALRALEAAGYPNAGSIGWSRMQAQFLEELTRAAALGGEWAYVGAMGVGTNAADDERRRSDQFRAIVLRALDAIRRDGVSWAALPPFAIDLWTSRYGYDGARPTGWASSNVSVPVPPRGEEPVVADLGPDEARLVATYGPDDGDRRIFLGRQPTDGRVAAVFDGVDLSDGIRKQWLWDGVEADAYVDCLRELGDRLGAPTYWAHPDLAPYFSSRLQTRDAMRAQARAMRFGEGPA
jgi:hypothetical protein